MTKAVDILSKVNAVRVSEGMEEIKPQATVVESARELVECDKDSYYVVDASTGDVIKDRDLSGKSADDAWRELLDDDNSDNLVVLYKDKDGNWKKTDNEGPTEDSVDFTVNEAHALDIHAAATGSKVKLADGREGTLQSRSGDKCIVFVDGESIDLDTSDVTLID